MTDQDVDNIYKSAISVSHYAGLRAVYDAGYQQGATITTNASTPDESLTQSPPTMDEPITTT